MKKIILLCLLVIGLLLVGCGTEVPSEGDLETPPIIEDQLTEDQQADLVMAGASEESGAIAGQAVTQSYYNCKEEGDNVIYDASWKQGMKSPKVSCNAAKNKVYLRSCAEGGFLDITLIYNCDCSNVDACLSGTAPTVNTCTLTTGGVSLSYSDGSTEEKVNFCLRGKVQEFSCDESASLKFKVQSTFCGSGNVCSAGVCTEPNVVTVSLLSAQMLELNAGDFPLYGGYILVDEQKISNICPSTWCDKNTPFTVSLPQELSEGEHEVEVWTKYQGWGFTSFEVEVLAAESFCYYLNSNGEQMPANTTYTDFPSMGYDQLREYGGIVTESNEILVGCKDVMAGPSELIELQMPVCLLNDNPSYMDENPEVNPEHFVSGVGNSGGVMTKPCYGGKVCEEGACVSEFEPITVEDVQAEGEVEVFVGEGVVNVSVDGKLIVSFDDDQKVTGVQIEDNKVLVIEETPGAGEVIKDVYPLITNNNAGAYLCPYAKNMAEINPDCSGKITDYQIKNGQYAFIQKSGGGAGEVEAPELSSFCYYMNQLGEQKSAGWDYYDFNTHKPYQGVVTEDGPVDNSCEEGVNTRQRCSDSYPYTSGGNVELGDPFYKACGNGCNPDTNSCCEITGGVIITCDGNNRINSSNTNCGPKTHTISCDDYGPENEDYTCYTPPENAVSYWKTDCIKCGVKICENANGYQKYSFMGCYNDWIEVGEITGPGC